MEVIQLTFSFISEEKKQLAQQAGATLQDIVGSNTENVSAQTRQRIGSINEQAKLGVNKMMDIHQNMPGTDCPDLNYRMLTDHFHAARFWELTRKRAESIAEQAGDQEMLHEYTLYQSLLVYYNFVKYKRKTNAPGPWDMVYRELKQFLGRSGGNGPNDPPGEEDEDDEDNSADA